MIDPFALLGAPRRFDLDLASLEKTHRELSRALHPDKFVQAGAGERRAALEKAASVNEAWRVVRDPIRRAEVLFELAGLAVGETKEPKPSPSFLMEMLEERETLAEARASRDLERTRKLGEGIQARARLTESKLAAAFGEAFVGEGATLEGAAKSKLTAALPLLGELRFYRRFLDEVDAIEDEALS